MRVTGGDARGRSRALDVRPRQSALPRQRAMLLATLSEQRGKADGPPCQRHNRACDRPRRITVTARPVRGRNAEDYCWRTRPTSAPVSLGGRAQIDPLPSWNVPRAWVYAALMSIEFESHRNGSGVVGRTLTHRRRSRVLQPARISPRRRDGDAAPAAAAVLSALLSTRNGPSTHCRRLPSQSSKARRMAAR
jgi:hypothetical protein